MELNLIGHKFKMPNMPNYLLFHNSNGTMDIGELHPDSYDEFEQKYIKALREHYTKRRKNV